MQSIKNIYSCNYIERGYLLPLEIWYNEVIDKDINSLTLTDVMRMLRQNIFTEIAVKRAISILKDNPIIGEMYEGELLEKLFCEKTKLYLQYKGDMENILYRANILAENYSWLGDEKKEFLNLLDKIKQEIQR